MQAILIYAEKSSFKSKEGSEIFGTTLVFLLDKGETKRFFVNENDTKGFDPSLVAQLKGGKVLISTGVKSYNGRMKEVLQSVHVA